MVNRHRSNWSKMGSSQFEFNNNLDEREQERTKVYDEFKMDLIEQYKQIVLSYSKQSDTVHIDNLIENGIRILMKEFIK